MIANYYADLSRKSYAQINKETEHYNNNIANGKWANIMSMKPRNLPVFQEPELSIEFKQRKLVWDAAVEGHSTDTVDKKSILVLPAFQQPISKKYFIDIFLEKEIDTKLNLVASNAWIKLSSASVQLRPIGAQSQARVWVEIDWKKVPQKAPLEGQVIIEGADQKIIISVITI